MTQQVTADADIANNVGYQNYHELDSGLDDLDESLREL